MPTKTLVLGDVKKVVIFSDLHAHDFKQFSEPEGDSTSRLRHILDSLDAIFKYTLDNGMEHVFFLGDLFHTRTTMKSIVFTKTATILRHYASKGLNLHFIPGNHDYIYNSSMSPVLFGELDCLDFISKPTIYPIDGMNYGIAAMPFRFKEDDIVGDISKLESELSNDTGNILLGHFETDCAMVTDEYVLPSPYAGVDIVGTKFSHVFSGHVHRKQKLNVTSRVGTDVTFQYVGTPIQHNFGDVVESNGFCVLDLYSHTYEMVSMDGLVHIPEFKTVEIHNDKDIETFLRAHKNRLSVDYHRFAIHNQDVKMNKLFSSVKFYKVEPKYDIAELPRLSDGTTEAEMVEFNMSVSELLNVFIEKQMNTNGMEWFDKTRFNDFVEDVVGSKECVG